MILVRRREMFAFRIGGHFLLSDLARAFGCGPFSIWPGISPA